MTRVWELWSQMHIVEHLWQMSLLAGLVIGFVLILRLLLRRCSKGYSYGLWLLVLLRLLCPVFIESDYSVQPQFLTGGVMDVSGQEGEQYPAAQIPLGANGLPGEKEGVPEGESGESMAMPEFMGMGFSSDYQAEGTMDGQGTSIGENSESHLITGDKAADNIYDNRYIAGAVNSGERFLRRYLPWLRGIYALGAGTLLLNFAAQYIRWKRKLRAAVHVRDNIWCSERVMSPFVLGVMRPRIYLPYGLEAQKMEHILLHEQSHIRHMDPLLRLLGTFALCLHWWNPLVWLGIHMFYQDMEMFCDETAMAQADLSRRQAYAATLLQFAIKQSGPAPVLAFGKTHTERRIRNVLEQKKRGRGIALSVVLAALAGGMLFLTVPRGVRAGMSNEDTDSQSLKQEILQDFVLSEGQVETSTGDMVTLRLVLTEGARTAYQTQEGETAENYEGLYELQVLDSQGQFSDRTALSNEQGGETMCFFYRDFPWYFEDYNLDGQQDFFVGTKTEDGRNYHYFFTITAQGELEYLFDGPMWGDYWPMSADEITNLYLESGGGEHDFRTLFLYQMNMEYSSHDFYTWSPEYEKYRKSVDFTGVYPEGWNREAADYLEGDWRITGMDIWSREETEPEYRIGETLSYTDGTFRCMDAAGNVKYESDIAGCSSLAQNAEEFENTFDVAWPSAYAQETRRILLNLGEGADIGNVVYVLDENRILVYDLTSQGVFWTAARVQQGEVARE